MPNQLKVNMLKNQSSEYHMMWVDFRFSHFRCEAYVLLGLRSYLEWFRTFSSGGQHTHLGAHHPPSDVTFLTHHHKFSHSIFLSILCVCLLVSLLCCSLVSLIIMSMVHHLRGHDHHVTLCPFSIPQLHLILTISYF